MVEVTNDNIHDLVDAWNLYVSSSTTLHRRRVPQPPVMSEWDVSRVTSFDTLFDECDEKVFKVPGNDIGGWQFGPGPITMRAMFFNCFYVPDSIADWDVSGVVDMSEMFTTGLLSNMPMDMPLERWNVSNVTRMNRMFSGRTNFNRPVGTWNVSKVTDMLEMFSVCTAFNQPLGDWDVSNVTNMNGMFWNLFSIQSKFNQPLEKWNVSNVIDMDFMFLGANAFNQSLKTWKIHPNCTVHNMLGCRSFCHFPPVFPESERKKDASHVFRNIHNSTHDAAIYRLYLQTITTNPYLRNQPANPTVEDIMRNASAIVFPAVLELMLVDRVANNLRANPIYDATRIDVVRRRVLELVGFV